MTLVGGTGVTVGPDVPTDGDERPPRPVWPLLLAAVVAVAVLSVVGAVRPDQPVAGPGEVDASLQLDVTSLSVTTTGVLVVPVQLRNLAGPLEVRRAQAFAEPVRLDPEVQSPPGLEALQTRRLIVLLAPDCRLLRSQAGLAFTAKLLVRVGAGSGGRDLVLDIGGDPGITDRVAGLCGRAGGPPGVPFSAP